MKSRRMGLAAMAVAGVFCGAAAGLAAEPSGDEVGFNTAPSAGASAAAYRAALADEPGVLLALGGGSGGGSGGGGSGGGGSGGGGSGDGDGDGADASGGTGSPEGDSADRGDPGADTTRTDRLGILGLTYNPTPVDLTVVRWRGPMTITAMPSPDARLAALSPEVRGQVTARRGPGQRTSELLDTTLLNNTSQQYAGASAFWSAPDVNAMVVEQQGVLRPVQVEPTTLRPVSPPTAGG